MVWPAFWGTIKGDEVTPLHPEAVNDTLRRTLRVRRGSTFREAVTDVRLSSEDKAEVLGEDRARTPESELTDEEKAKLEALTESKGMEAFREKLATALEELKEIITEQGAEPVFISGGRAYRLNQEGAVEEFSHDATKPYAWTLAHDVRPARWSIGVKGCFDCHESGAPIFYSTVTALGQAPDEEPITLAAHQLVEEFDETKLAAWNQSFQGRTAFKWMGFFAMGVVGLILLSYLLLGINGLFGMVRRR
jgi:hypothetical protein